MNDILEVVKYTLPALIVFLTAYLLIRNLIRNDEKKRMLEITLSNQKTILPVRLQAYERLTLFLERISPESILMRVNQANKNNKQYQTELLSTIRAEFEHNVSQQVYVSTNAWEMVKGAKGSLINIINAAAEQIKPDASALALSKKILENVMELKTPPTAQALEFLKKEMRQFF